MLKTFSITDIGKRRKTNQDYVFTSEIPLGNLPNLFIVADGMGGHNAGDYASKYTVETIVEEIKKTSETNPVKILKKAIEIANDHIRTKALSDEGMAGMGTTVVAAACIGRYLQIANVGDSRLYIINPYEIRQITVDHSLVAEMVRLGGLDKGEAKTHPDKNIITRAVGAQEEVEIDFFAVEIQDEDMILLCSDGLTNMLDDEEIQMIFNKQRDIAQMAEELVKTANNNGGRDNISVVIVAPFANEVKK